MIRSFILIIRTLVAAGAILLVAPTLLSFLGDKAAESSLVVDGPFSMGPLDTLADMVLIWVPLSAVLGIVGVAFVMTVARLALAGRV
jgi:hypothetical protein